MASSSTSSDKISKIIARLQARIAEGAYYEAQQQTRVVAARYIKAANWTAAIDILYSVAQSLLRAGQGGSGGDLCVLLVDTYRQAALQPDADTKGRLLTCLRLFDSAEPTRKKYIGEMLTWSSKFGEYPAGDPELHHVAGSLYAEEHEPIEAERHLVLGTRDSAEVLTRLEYDWFREDDSHTAALYAGRAVLPYLLVANVHAANVAYKHFTNALVRDQGSSMSAQDVSSSSADMRAFPSAPLLNFLGLLLLAIQRGTADLYRQLTTKYNSLLREVEEWHEPLEMIAEMYFNITRPRQSNPLMDMMSGIFGGSDGASRPPRRTVGQQASSSMSLPAEEALD